MVANAPRVAVVGIPGKWSTEVLADRLEDRTGFRLVVDMEEVCADLSTGALQAGGQDLTQLDGIAVKKISQVYSPNTLDRIELLRLAEARGVRVFSPAETIVRMIDRLACTVTLRNGGIPMPETVATENLDEALAALRRFGEAVLKPLFSTKARGMMVLAADASDEKLLKVLDKFRSENQMMYLQKKLELPGKDYGMVYIGGNYHGAYARVAEGDSWNTTIISGGKYAPHSPTREAIEVAGRAQALFGMDFTTVDVADTPDGPIVFEVSAFGGFKGAHEGIGIDAAALYADHIIKELSR